MATLMADDILDLVKGTQKDLGELKFEQIAQNYQDYHIWGYWLKKDKVQQDSGIGIQRTLMTSLPESAVHMGLYEEEQYSQKDLLQQMSIPWKYARSYWVGERHEALQNRGEALILNVVKPRRIGAMIALVEELEAKGWGCPLSSTDTKVPYGMSYYITGTGATSTVGFNGTGLTGVWTTDVAGVNPTTTAKWRNCNGTYAAATKADLVSQMRDMQMLTGWKSPIDVNDYRNGKGEKYRLYCNRTTYKAITDIGESQNENLGKDIASMDGTIVFRGHSIFWVQELDSWTSGTGAVPVSGYKVKNPIFWIDHSTFYPVVLKGDYLHESEPRWRDSQPDVWVVRVTLSYNYLCVDRRRNGLLYQT